MSSYKIIVLFLSYKWMYVSQTLWGLLVCFSCIVLTAQAQVVVRGCSVSTLVLVTAGEKYFSRLFFSLFRPW